VVDVRVIVYDGKHHSVDTRKLPSSPPAARLFMAAIREARPIVLEPIVHVENHRARCGDGDITGDLSAKRGLVSGTANGTVGTMIVRGRCRCRSWRATNRA